MLYQDGDRVKNLNLHLEATAVLRRVHRPAAPLSGRLGNQPLAPRPWAVRRELRHLVAQDAKRRVQLVSAVEAVEQVGQAELAQSG